MAALEIVDLVGGYTPKVDVLHGVAIDVHPQEAVAILGANGAGKSTLLRVVSGLIAPRQGSIRFNGAEITGVSPHRIARAGLAHVPEGRQVFVRQTVADNLRLGGMGSQGQEERLERLLDVFPVLRDKLGQRAGELSGGQQQMLAIARGLMSQPSLLMLDEPSLGLSPKLVDEVIELLARVRRELKTAFLLVEQNAAVAAGVADRAYVMRRGEVVGEEHAQALLGNDQLLSAYLG
ncbi:MAG: branched-chain amino acid transport system ATP-binding protein [Thermoleophilaceae bacterium]|jgi:branched-chain amino acid transport system ATP-binding protein|nr:branched-chain amino acid transport system ATP-binding protein [Thermoleophilaceae bacterium]